MWNVFAETAPANKARRLTTARVIASCFPDTIGRALNDVTIPYKRSLWTLTTQLNASRKSHLLRAQ